MNTLGQEYQNLNTNVVKQNSNIRLSFDFKLFREIQARRIEYQLKNLY